MVQGAEEGGLIPYRRPEGARRRVAESVAAGAYRPPPGLPAARHLAENARLTVRFYRDVCEAYGLGERPVGLMLWRKAWSLGWRDGLEEVLHQFDDLVGILEAL